MITKLEIVFANGSKIDYSDVHWFSFQQKKLTMCHSKDRQTNVFKIEEVMSIYVLSVEEDEPSLDLPFGE